MVMTTRWVTDLLMKTFATTMEAIAEHGRAGFYEGWVADDSFSGSLIHLEGCTRKTILMQRWQIMLPHQD